MPVDPAVRRRLLQGLGAIGAGAAAAGFARAARAPGVSGARDLCLTPPRFDTPLHVPGDAGLLGRVDATGPLLLRASPRGRDGALAYTARFGGRDYLDPTLVARTGARVRVTLENGIDAPTVAHWHGLTMDTANDGNGEALIAPNGSFDYAYTVRNRAGLYWYHPHPHGATAGQACRGLFGMLAVEDDEEAALRAALELTPGVTEIPLVLHDRRADAAPLYAPSADDVMFGWLGDETQVNFTSRPSLDVAARRYRFRVLNATNARNFRLAFRRDDAHALPFLLIGTDGGLLETPVACAELFLSPAERVDVLVDFSGIAPGGYALLESRAFDPMHAVARSAAAPAASGPADSHAMASPVSGGARASRVPDGTPQDLLQFRIRAAAGASPAVPQRLSASPPPSRDANAVDRPLRLGFAKGRWRINDRVYDMAETPIVVPRSAVETWLIRNYHTSMPHAMHLHGFQFRVLARETSPDALAPLVVADNGRVASDLGWKDTVLVWPGESVKIAIDFRHPFATEQVYLFHCHNLEHEDAGMMLRVKVG